MKTASLALLVGSAAAFAPAQTGRASTANSAGIDDLKEIAVKANPVVKVCSRSSVTALARDFDRLDSH